MKKILLQCLLLIGILLSFATNSQAQRTIQTARMKVSKMLQLDTVLYISADSMRSIRPSPADSIEIIGLASGQMRRHKIPVVDLNIILTASQTVAVIADSLQEYYDTTQMQNHIYEFVDTVNTVATQLERISGEITTTSTAQYQSILPVNTSTGPITVNPPPSPYPGRWFSIVDARATASTNPITIDFIAAGQLLHAASQNYVINTDAYYVKFVYVNSTIGWIAED